MEVSMKYFTFFLFLATTFLAFGQNSPTYKGASDIIQSGTKAVESVTVYRVDGSKQRNLYTYDANGNITSWAVEKHQNGEWVNYLRHTYTYDLDNRELTMQQDVWTYAGDWAWKPFSKFTKNYDNKGNLITQLNELWKNDVWSNSSRYSYTYDEYNNKTEYVFEKFEFKDDWKWVVYSHYIYVYNNNNDISEEVYESFYNNQIAKSK